MQQIKGEMIIGRSAVVGKEGAVKAVDPSRNEQIEPAFGLASTAELEKTCTLAEQAFDTYRETTPEQRAKFLETIADRIMDLGTTLIERAMQETGLPQARLEGERGRTCNQLRLFAKVVRDGRYLSATLDSALPDRAPAPAPTCVCARSAWARSPCSAHRISRWRSPWPVATPRPRWRQAAPSS